MGHHQLRVYHSHGPQIQSASLILLVHPVCLLSWTCMQAHCAALHNCENSWCPKIFQAFQAYAPGRINPDTINVNSINTCINMYELLRPSWCLRKAWTIHETSHLNASLLLALSSIKAFCRIGLKKLTLMNVRRGGADCMEGHASEFCWYNPLSSKLPLDITPDGMVGRSGVVRGQSEPCSTLLLPENPFCCSLVFSKVREVRDAETVRGWSIGTPKRRWLRSACNCSASWSFSLNPKGGCSTRPAWALTSWFCGCVKAPTTWEEVAVSTWPNRAVAISCGSVWIWFCIVENQGEDTCDSIYPCLS